VIGLEPAIYATVYLIFSIWNGVNDPLIGLWADKAAFIEGKGKYKRLIRKSIPLFALPVIMLLFAQPSWNQTVLAIYLLILMVIYEAAQTLLNVSFNSFKVNTFISAANRTKMQTVGTYVEQIPVFAAGIVPMMFLTGEYSNQVIVTVFTIAIIIGVFLVIIGSKFIKEDSTFYERIEITKGLSELWQFFKLFIREKTFFVFLIGMFLINVATGNYFIGYLYYMDNVLLEEGARVVIPDILTGISQMIILPFIIIWVKRYGAKKTLAYGMILSVIGHFVLTFDIGYWIAAPTYIVILLGYAFASATMIPLQGIVVDDLEIKTGKRQPGVISGILQMFFLSAAGVQVLLLGALLSATGYVGSIREQTPEVVRAIRIGVGLIPSIILFIGLIIFSLWPIGKKEEDELLVNIEAKHKRDQQIFITEIEEVIEDEFLIDRNEY